jgi:tripartite-type tricarboxylate transporter receptor subunit TctC
MKRLSGIAAVASCLALSAGAQAQVYPAKPVRVVVPAAPGGGLDQVARIFTTRLSESWGQQAVVENRAGANFIVGTESVARAAPDGYTLLFTSHGALTINPVAFSNLPYSPRDLAPIMLVYMTPSALIVNSALPVANVQELVAHLKANPGKLNHASNSASTMLASELFKAIARVDYQDINYKGGVLAAAATAAGEVQFCIVDLGSATSQVRGGRARLLALTTPQRSKLRPDTPTMAEAGVPGYSYTGMGALLAPVKTSPDIVNRVNAEMAKVLAQPDVAAKIEAAGGEVFASSVADAGRLLREELERWTQLVKERNLKFP